jgi:glutathione synthase/RimK-type ligase-like ATP-grasp enzyme
MKLLLIVPNPKKIPIAISGVEVVAARRYLTEPIFAKMSGVRIFNLCSSFRYQTIGYYVSLIAEARGHKPVPNITTMRDLQTPAILRMTNAELHDLMHKSLRKIKQDKFTLSIYFGRNLAKQYDSLCKELFNRYHAPLMRAELSKNKDGNWAIQSIRNVGLGEIPDNHFDFLTKRGEAYFTQHGYRSRKPQTYRYSLAILYNQKEENAPSNLEAIRKFIKAGERNSLEVKVITREDFGRIPEFDGLFIRETTNVNNHTFRFARYAEANQLVVMDDSQSIIRCANKVYLAELLAHYRLKTPKTMIVHRDNVDLISYQIGLPCVLKQPDSAFSLGVFKVTSDQELRSAASRLLEKSELIIAQEFLPTSFDWRIGVLDRKPLFACRYYMVEDHWQIIKHGTDGKKEDEGYFDTLPLEEMQPDVLKLAVRASQQIGNGLYGVDIKQCGKNFYVIEVNDNPNIDAGVEDLVLKDELYETIIKSFIARIEKKKAS